MDILLIVSIIIALGAQVYINSAYNKNNKISSSTGIKGCEAARRILDRNGLTNVEVEMVGGYLSDHYDPRTKKVRLSSNNYNTNSISAIAVAAHECGHALQDKDNYTFMRIRASLVPLVNFSSYAGYISIMIGIIAGALNFIMIGIITEMIILLFQMVTLPVEFNASKRALTQVQELALLTSEEHKKGKKVLRAAAMTYVASVATSLIQILRLLLIYGSRRD